MASPRFQPVGPINQGTKVLLAAIINDAPYIATYDSNLKDCIFRFMPSRNATVPGINPLVNEQSLLVLNYQGVLERGVFVDETRQLQLLPYFNSGSPYLSLQFQGSAPLPSLVSQYARPPAPAVLLSGASYEVRGAPDATRGESVIGVRYWNPTNGGVLFAAARVIPIYYKYIASSGSAGTLTCSTANDSSLSAAQVFFCSWARLTSNTREGTYCTAKNVPVVTWTTPGDCSSNFPYNYCPAGTTCGGEAKCYAECANGGDCVVRSGKMVCTGTPSGGGGGGSTQPLEPVAPRRIEPLPKADTPWYESTWFIIAVIAFIVSVVFVVYLYVKNSDTALVAEQQYATSDYAQNAR